MHWIQQPDFVPKHQQTRRLMWSQSLQARSSGKAALPEPEALVFDKLVVDAATTQGAAKFTIEHRKADGCLLAVVLVR
jgi:hypothetical protein